MYRSLLSLITVAALILISLHSANAEQYETSVLSVDGRGEITVSPDMAVINISVETNATNAKEAVSENTQKTNKVVSVLKGLIGPKDNLKTTEYTLYPVYEYNETKKKSFITSYRVTSEVRVKTFQLDKLGEIIDVTTDAGANRISGPAFDNSNKDENKRNALAKAVEDARETAKTVASAAGVELVRIVRITPSYNYPMPVFKQNYRSAVRAESSDAPVIESGDMTVEANVSIVYEIRQ